MTRAMAAASFALVLCAAACGSSAPNGPPEIRLGFDACDGCGMAIGDVRYAAAALVEDGAERQMLKFDDIGCLARWEAGRKGSDVRERWVHDWSTGSWIDAATASYAQPPDVITPMGSGLVAFANPSDAAALSWNAILARAREDSR